MNINFDKAGWTVRFVASAIAIVVALNVGMKFLPTWAAYAAAVVACLVVQEATVLVFDEIKGRKQRKETV